MSDVGYETIELYKEEVDERYFTEQEWAILQNICMVTAIYYVSEAAEEYLMMDVYGDI